MARIGQHDRHRLADVERAAAARSDDRRASLSPEPIHGRDDRARIRFGLDAVEQDMAEARRIQNGREPADDARLHQALIGDDQNLLAAKRRDELRQTLVKADAELDPSGKGETEVLVIVQSLAP